MQRRIVSACAIAAAACSSKPSPSASSTGSGSADVEPAKHVRKSRALDPHDSSVTARDYIGPDACGECHPDEHALWSQSLHRTMNQRATPAGILGSSATVTYAGGTMTFDRDARTMTLARGDRTVRYRVTRTIGTRGLQEYVGIAEGSREEVRLPFGWWPRRAGWYPQPYFDPWLDEARFDPYAKVTDPWAQRCPWCHSTYPFAQRIARASQRPVGHGLELHFTTKPPAGDPERLQVDQQVTVGISCESCHLGGRAHADGAPIHFIPIGATPRPGAPRPTTFEAERKDPAIVNRVCAQCHSGPSPRFPDGSAARNSSEALDLAASSCTARCVDCHDPHRADARHDEARAIAACVRCHRSHADPIHAGTGHEHVTCLDCHMPRIVLGIDRHVRTHRIGSPTDRRMLGASAPNACNLCHLDRTLQWTAAALRADYQAHLGRARWDDDHPAGELWLANAEPALRLIAASAYARAPKAWLPSGADLVPLLADPAAYVRAWAAFTIEDLTGHPIDYDPRAPPEVRRTQIERLGRMLRSRR